MSEKFHRIEPRTHSVNMAFRHAWKPEGHFMPQFPKPFFVKARQVWRVQINGKQINLGREKQRAFQSYHELLSRPEPVAADYVTGILDGYLDWCQKHRSHRTFEWYKSHLESFVNSLEKPEEMTTDDLRPFHVQDWVDQHPTWGSSHRRGAITAVQRAFSWAEKLGHIQKSPIRYIEKPAGGRREQVISSEEFGRQDGAHFQPRMHDLRHTFAIHRLTEWYRQGADVQKLLPHLSAYLGHCCLSSTQVYLSMTPELLQQASNRFERYAGQEDGHD